MSEDTATRNVLTHLAFDNVRRARGLINGARELLNNIPGAPEQAVSEELDALAQGLTAVHERLAERVAANINRRQEEHDG